MTLFPTMRTLYDALPPLSAAAASSRDALLAADEQGQQIQLVFPLLPPEVSMLISSYNERNTKDEQAIENYMRANCFSGVVNEHTLESLQAFMRAEKISPETIKSLDLSDLKWPKHLYEEISQGTCKSHPRFALIYQCFPQLKKLVMMNTHEVTISDECLRNSFECLIDIEMLVLSYSPCVDDAFILNLYEEGCGLNKRPFTLPQLAILDLTGCPVTQGAKNRLRSCRPHLTIIG